MFNALKMKIAARRVDRKTAARKNKTKSRNRAAAKSARTFWARAWDVICAPFRAAGRACRRIWAWISGLNVVGLVNSTLLCAIIVLFSMLTIDIVRSHRTPLVIVAQNDIETTVGQQIVNRPSAHKVNTPALPIRRNVKTRQFINKPINVARTAPDMVAIKQTARVGKTMYGDVIIDSRGAATMLKPGDVIKGNLYLQSMRKYILPCGVRIEGNLFLRDMGMLQFAGEFTVTGNIYVTPTSSFGPIPRTARIGGQVII